MQGIDQLKDHYGPAAGTILSNCAYKWFCNVSDLESAKYLSDTLGKATVRTVGKGESHNEGPGGAGKGESINYGETGRPLLMPDEVLALGREVAIVLNPDGRPHYLRPVDYWRIPEAFASLMTSYRKLYWEPPLAWDENPYFARRGEGGDERKQAAPPSGKMSREEALAILGLAEGASAADIRAAWKRLMQKVHPDVGGSMANVDREALPKAATAADQQRARAAEAEPPPSKMERPPVEDFAPVPEVKEPKAENPGLDPRVAEALAERERADSAKLAEWHAAEIRRLDYVLKLDDSEKPAALDRQHAAERDRLAREQRTSAKGIEGFIEAMKNRLNPGRGAESMEVRKKEWRALHARQDREKADMEVLLAQNRAEQLDELRERHAQQSREQAALFERDRQRYAEDAARAARLPAQRAHEQIARPALETAAAVEHHARWRDGRRPVIQGLLKTARRMRVRDRQEIVMRAIARLRPAVIPARQRDIDLIAPARPMLGGPQRAAGGFDRRALHVPVAKRPYLRLRARQVQEGVVSGGRPVRSDMKNLAHA